MRQYTGPGGLVGEDGPLGLLLRIFEGTPRLRGAACAGRPKLFDGVTIEDAQKAIAPCRSCPALAPCSDWAEGRRGLVGVVAGKRHFLHHRDVVDDGVGVAPILLGDNA